MKKNFLLLICFAFYNFNFCNAQITFQKTFDGFIYDAANSVHQTTDGGYIIAGHTGIQSNASCYGDAILIKTDMYGDTLWTKTYGDTLNDYFNSADQTLDGGYIAVGKVGSGSYYSYLVKTDAAGDTLWTRAYNCNFNYVQQTTDGGFAIAARGLAGEFGMIKMNSSGFIEWSGSYPQPYSQGANALQQTRDGGYIVVGNILFGSTVPCVLVGRFDNIGNFVWINQYGNLNGTETGNSVAQTDDGGFVVAGVSRDTFNTDDELLLMKTDSMGNLLWSNAYEGGLWEAGNTVHQVSGGAIIICGTSSGTNNYHPFLIKTDSAGTPLWTKTTSERAAALSLGCTNDGGYVIAGSIEDSTGSNTSDLYLEKTDSSGNSGCNQNIPAFAMHPLSFTTWSGGILTVPYIDTTYVPTGTLISSGCGVATLCTTVGIAKPVQSTIDFKGYLTANTLSLTFSSVSPSPILRVSLSDITGRILYQTQLTVTTGINKKEIQVGDLAKGIYIVTLSGNMGSESVKVVKE